MDVIKDIIYRRIFRSIPGKNTIFTCLYKKHTNYNKEIYKKQNKLSGLK